MPRAVKEWVGKTADGHIPPRVRLRTLEKDSGRCQLCLRPIYPGDKWECDHVVALVNGGENRESNLAALCSWCHDKKTKLDVAKKALAYASKKRHLGLKKSRNPMPGSRASKWKRKMDGTVVER